jgi:hypothetical protein
MITYNANQGLESGEEWAERERRGALKLVGDTNK